jgi:hypothetical protein
MGGLERGVKAPALAVETEEEPQRHGDTENGTGSWVARLERLGT